MPELSALVGVAVKAEALDSILCLSPHPTFDTMRAPPRTPPTTTPTTTTTLIIPSKAYFY